MYTGVWQETIKSDIFRYQQNKIINFNKALLLHLKSYQKSQQKNVQINTLLPGRKSPWYSKGHAECKHITWSIQEDKEQNKQLKWKRGENENNIFVALPMFISLFQELPKNNITVFQVDVLFNLQARECVMSKHLFHAYN